MGKFTIKAPVTFTGSGWGLAFVEGVAQTDDAYLAHKLRQKGYTVTEAAAAAYICPVCQKLYKSEKGLKDHMAKEHPDYTPDGTGE